MYKNSINVINNLQSGLFPAGSNPVSIIFILRGDIFVSCRLYKDTVIALDSLPYLQGFAD